jgi:predicted CXXCH cytochrome family protein
LIRRRRVLLALFVLLAAVPARGAGDLVVLYPRDMTLKVDNTIKIYAYQPGGGVPTDVKVNGVVAARLDGGEFRKGEAVLGPGFNFVDVGKVKLRVFNIPGVKIEKLAFGGDQPSQQISFQAYNLHPALDEGCEVCHTLEGGKLAAKDQKEACYACHTDFGAAEEGKTKFLHAPVAAGECTSCHDPHLSSLPKLQKLEKGCFECHDPFPANGVVHRPVAAGECKACHSPHVGVAQKQLLRAGNALCLGCHESSHAQHRSAAVQGTMTVVPDDFPRDKEQLSCLGCHLPHQSAERRLFRMEQGTMCRTCHPV